MAPGAVMVLVNGWVLDRSSVVQSLNESPPWDEYTIDEARLVPINDAAAALVYRATASRADEEPFVALMASHYCRTQEGIRLAFYQQTTITH